MTKKAFLALFLALAFIFCTACGTTPAAQSGQARTDLNVAMLSEPDTLDPNNTMDSVAAMINFNIYDHLVRFDPAAEKLVGCLAKEWKISDDGLVYTFYLNEGVKYHNGKVCNAEEVKKCFEHVMENAIMAYVISMCTEIKVTDEYTIEFHLAEPYSPFLAGLAMIGITDVDAYEEMGAENYARSPIGTGPYKFVSWTAGDKVVLESNPDYFRGEPPIKNLTFKVIPNSNSMVIALENGEIDFAFDIASIDIASIEANEKFNFYSRPSNYIEFLYFNCAHEPWNNPKVRKAISLCIDKQAIVDVAFEGRCDVADQPLAPQYLGFIDNYAADQRDVEKAKALLAEAGYPDGFTTTIRSMDGFRDQAAQVIQANLAEIGIKAEIELLDFAVLLDAGAAGDYEMHIMELGDSATNTYYELVYNFYTPLFGPNGNYGFCGDEYTDELLESSLLTTDEAELAEIYGNLIRYNEEQMFCVPLFNRHTNTVANADLEGAYVHPLMMVEFRQLSWK